MSKPPAILNPILPFSPENVVAWHKRCGGHANNGFAHHAVRLLHEAIELAYACGASPEAVGGAVAQETAKAGHRDWPLPVPISMPLSATRMGEIAEESADVQLLGIVLRHYAGIPPLMQTAAREEKFMRVQQRDFHADENGVLWRRKA